MTRKNLFFKLLTATVFFSTSCKKQNNTYDIPDVPISEHVYISNPTNFDLQFQGGYVYRQAGYRGLIIYRRYLNNAADDFVAYERACPIHYNDQCSQTSVVDDLIVRCSCDDKEFSIFDGSPFNDNPSPSLKFYRTTFDGVNTITISN